MNSSYGILILSVFIAAVSQILLKKSALKKYKSVIWEYLNPYVIVGYGLMFGSTILTIIALKGMAYSNVPVIECLGYIFVMIMSRMFLGEKVTKKKIIGNGLIILGILVYYM